MGNAAGSKNKAIGPSFLCKIIVHQVDNDDAKGGGDGMTIAKQRRV